jgi:hypothetical protein
MRCPPESAEILLDILRTGLIQIRALGWSGDAAACAAEADHLHNLPDLLANFSPERLRYYWDVERPAYLNRCGPDNAELFGPLWTRLGALVAAPEEQSQPVSVGR